VQPPIGAALYAGSGWASMLMERAPHGVAFVASESPQPGSQDWLAITRNDGGTWHKTSCRARSASRSAQSRRHDRLLLCGVAGSAGSGPKAIYVSFDGGTT